MDYENWDSLLATAVKAEEAENWHAAGSAYGLLHSQTKSEEHLTKMAFCSVKAGRPEAALDAYASDLRFQEPRHLFALATEMIRAGDMIAATKAIHRGLDFAEDATNLDRSLAAYPRWYPQRRRIGKFIEKRIKSIRTAAGAMEGAPPGDPKIFIYWNSGFSSAPAIVRACHAELLRLHPNDVVALDEKTWPFYVNIPSKVLEKVPQNSASFSDVLRMALLARYGGVWVDATCFPSTNLIEFHREVSANGFFAYERNDGARISSWFLMSSGDNYIAKMMYAAACSYWGYYGKAIHYFWIHHIFETLYFLDPKFAEIWGNRVRKSASPPHFIQRQMFDEFDATGFAKLSGSAAVHKLTYKLKDRVPEPGSYVSHLVRRDLAHPPLPIEKPEEASPNIIKPTASDRLIGIWRNLYARACAAGFAGAALFECLDIFVLP